MTAVLPSNATVPMRSSIRISDQTQTVLFGSQHFALRLEWPKVLAQPNVRC